MFPRKKENEKQKTEAQPASNANPAPTGEPAETQKKTEELSKIAEGLQKEKDEIFAKLQRVAADYDNYQKRTARQTAESIAYEKDRIIKALLPVMDNFEHLLANANCGAQDEALLKGVRIIYDQMLGVLKGLGVEQIKAAGERFDPAYHQAITIRSENGKEEGIILEELQRGYMLNGRVIRASRVAVNKAAINETEQEPETKDTQ
jgi:molecular chaperone GrpE